MQSTSQAPVNELTPPEWLTTLTPAQRAICDELDVVREANEKEDETREYHFRLRVVAGSMMLGASLAWCITGIVNNLTGDAPAPVGTIAVSTPVDATQTAFSASYVVRPINDSINISQAVSQGAGGSLKVDINDDLSPMKGDRHSTVALGSIAISSGDNPGFEDAPAITPAPLSEEIIQGFEDAVAAARAAAADNLSPMAGDVRLAVSGSMPAGGGEAVTDDVSPLAPKAV